MRRILVALSVSLLGTGIFSAKASQNPSEVLSRAVSLTRTCGFYSERTDYDKHGRGMIASPDESDSEAITNLSIPILFREGRFNLSFGEGRELPDGTPAIVIRFTPRAEGRALGPLSGESENYARVMNAMAGVVLVDPISEGIFRVEGYLTKKTVAKWHGIKLGDLTTVNFRYDQVKSEEEWRPSYLEVRVIFDRIFWGGIYNRIYKAKFTCD